MKRFLKHYRITLITGALFLLLLVIIPEIRQKASESLFNQAKTILLVIPPIFILLGLFDVWVPREVMTQHLGNGSGIKGIIIAFVLGSATTGPLYGAFPVAAVLAKKGSSFFNILIFIGAWSTTKIPMLLFEIKAMGPTFALTRFATSIVGIITIALIINLFISKHLRTESLELLSSKYI